MAKVKGFRNHIVHDYTGIDFEMTFDIIKSELSLLTRQLEALITKGLNENIFDVDEFEVAKASQYYSHVDFKHMDHL